MTLLWTCIIGIGCVGTALTGYLRIAGTWAADPWLSATDSAILAAGYLGLFMTDMTSRLDNFGGGPFSASPYQSLFRVGGDLSGMGAAGGRFFGNPLARVMAHARLVTTSWRRSGSGLFVPAPDLVTVPASA